MRFDNRIRILLLVLFLGGVLPACGREYDNREGMRFIMPLGNPPAESVIWSPINNDEILVTASQLGQGRAEVYVMNIKSKTKRTLVETEWGDIWAETWLPDGSNVILLISPDTKEFKKGGYWMTNTNGDSLEFLWESGRPTWSPDGKFIAIYTVDHASGSEPREIQLRLRDVKTNSDEVLFAKIGTQSLIGFSWSPDSHKLVYSLGDFNSSNIYVMDIGTRIITQLTRIGRNSNPVWSPKENVIAYIKVTDDGLIYALHLIRPDGTCDIEIPNLEDVWSPTWSPDGKKLAFVTLEGVYYLEVDKVFGEGGYESLCP